MSLRFLRVFACESSFPFCLSCLRDFSYKIRDDWYVCEVWVRWRGCAQLSSQHLHVSLTDVCAGHHWSVGKPGKTHAQLSKPYCLDTCLSHQGHSPPCLHLLGHRHTHTARSSRVHSLAGCPATLINQCEECLSLYLSTGIYLYRQWNMIERQRTTMVVMTTVVHLTDAATCLPVCLPAAIWLLETSSEQERFPFLVFLFSCVCVCVLQILYPGVGLLGHTVAPFLIFWGASPLFSIVAAAVDVPTISVGGFPVLHTLSCIYHYRLFDDGHSASTVVAHCSFDLHFPHQRCWASFHVPVDHLCVFSREMSIQVLCPFFNQVAFFFFWYWVGGAVYECWIPTSYQSNHLQIFSPMQ